MEQKTPLILAGAEAAGALFSPCRTYRYRLWRRWESGPSVLWVMLNPSTADELTLDPTVTRCRNFTRVWGYAALEVVNLFAYRATLPRILFSVPEPVGPANDAAILLAAERNTLVMLAWGNHGVRESRSDKVLELLSGNKKALHCLGLTRAGQPLHPLYLPGDLTPIPFQVTGND